MNWDAVGAIGEIGGAVAVIATLVYLAIQIRESTRASRSAAITDATTAMQDFYQELGSNPQTCQVVMRALTDPESLSKEEELQYLMMMHSQFMGFQLCFFLVQEGTLGVGLRDSIGTAVNAISHLPGMDLYWNMRKAYFQPEFVTWVEELRQRQPTPDLQLYRDFLSASPPANSRNSG